MSVHSIAEMYAALTRLPVHPRIHPAEAVRIITDNIFPHFEMVPVGKEDYTEALRLVGNGGWAEQGHMTHLSAPETTRAAIWTALRTHRAIAGC